MFFCAEVDACHLGIRKDHEAYQASVVEYHPRWCGTEIGPRDLANKQKMRRSRLGRWSARSVLGAHFDIAICSVALQLLTPPTPVGSWAERFNSRSRPPCPPPPPLTTLSAASRRRPPPSPTNSSAATCPPHRCASLPPPRPGLLRHAPTCSLSSSTTGASRLLRGAHHRPSSLPPGPRRPFFRRFVLCCSCSTSIIIFNLVWPLWSRS